MVDRFLAIFFGAGLVAPLYAPTVGAAAAEADDADDFGLFGEAGQVRGHRPAGRVTEGDDFAAGEMLVGEQAGALENDVEGAFQIAIEDFFSRQFSIHQINRHALGDGHVSKRRPADNGRDR